MATKRRKFSRELKLEAVRLITEKGYSVAQVGRDLDLRPDMLRRWQRQLAADPGGAFPGEGHLRAEDRELVRLRRENERLREERDILKKGAGDRLGAPAVRYAVIQRHRHQYPVRRMCRVLDVSPSDYYAWCSRPESARAREDRRLKLLIREIFHQSGETYGSPRIAVELCARGERCGKHRVARLMREEGLVARKPRRFQVTTDSEHSWPVAPNLLDQQFHGRDPRHGVAGRHHLPAD